MRSLIFNLIQAIRPHDSLEQQMIADTMAWIESGADLFRRVKPASPDKHLVVYYLMVDDKQHKVLLHRHGAADLWLPSGGHIRPDEHPQMAVCREVHDMFHFAPPFLILHPFFLSACETVEERTRHTDVALWYLLGGDADQQLPFQKESFADSRWFGFDEIPYNCADPHLGRLLDKMVCSTVLRPNVATA